jgi:hypothetical protein
LSLAQGDWLKAETCQNCRVNIVKEQVGALCFIIYIDSLQADLMNPILQCFFCVSLFPIGGRKLCHDLVEPKLLGMQTFDDVPLPDIVHAEIKYEMPIPEWTVAAADGRVLSQAPSYLLYEIIKCYCETSTSLRSAKPREGHYPKSVRDAISRDDIRARTENELGFTDNCCAL